MTIGPTGTRVTHTKNITHHESSTTHDCVRFFSLAVTSLFFVASMTNPRTEKKKQRKEKKEEAISARAKLGRRNMLMVNSIQVNDPVCVLDTTALAFRHKLKAIHSPPSL